MSKAPSIYIFTLLDYACTVTVAMTAKQHINIKLREKISEILELQIQCAGKSTVATIRQDNFLATFNQIYLPLIHLTDFYNSLTVLLKDILSNSYSCKPLFIYLLKVP